MIALFLPAMNLFGWIFDLPLFRSLLPNLPPMVPLTALMLICLAANLLITSSAQARRGASGTGKSRWLSLGLATVVLIVGLWAIASHVFDMPFFVSRWLFWHQVVLERGILYQGNMSMQSASSMILLTIGMTLLQFPRNRQVDFFVQLLPLLAMTLSFIAYIGYIHDITEFYGSSRFVGLSFPTALSVSFLSAGILSLRPDSGIYRRLRGSGAAPFFLRRFLVFSFMAPTVTTFLISFGEEQGLYPSAFSSALFVLLTILTLTAIGIYIANAVQRLETQQMALQQARSKAALRESEESLKETKERLEFALEASRMGTWETDWVTKATRWSPITERLFGLPVGSFPGSYEAFTERLHPEDRERVDRECVDAMRTRKELDSTYRCIWPDGTIHWLRSVGRAKFDERGNPLALSGTVIDMTNEKLYQETIEEALEAAESASRLKSAFLANMSHEIRTPLGAILGFADLLAEPESTTEEKENYLGIIRRNGETLSHLINDILDLSKVESGRLDVERVRFSLRDVVDEVVALLSVRAQEKSLPIKVSYATGLPEHIVSDPIRLKQILTNLIGNAVKFTSKGEVSVAVSFSWKNQVIFDIADTGIGINAAQQEKLFQSFSQADGSMTRRFGGTGLGLVLSRKLAEILGGTVELLTSLPGQGSTFRASIRDATQSLNVAKPPAGGAGATSVPRGDRLIGRRILLVEDLPDNQRMIGKFLTQEGAALDVAVNGADGVHQALMEEYDAVLMDLQMPVMDGYSATAKLRHRGYKVPIIALTAHAMADVEKKCLSVGCNAYLTKPVDREQLVRTILEQFPKPELPMEMR
ncbi:MAG: response regulator [Bdellovibrionaceae bacterium]|nr:response regulator [Pseudobdellovibrionaceae bacterium]